MANTDNEGNTIMSTAYIFKKKNSRTFLFIKKNDYICKIN